MNFVTVPSPHTQSCVYNVSDAGPEIQVAIYRTSFETLVMKRSSWEMMITPPFQLNNASIRASRPWYAESQCQ